MLTNEQALELMREAGSLLEGHFLLTSGKHSARYLLSRKIAIINTRTEDTPKSDSAHGWYVHVFAIRK